MDVVHPETPALKVCVKCGGSMAKSLITGFSAKVKVKPLEQTFFDFRESELIGYTCGDCGFTELYAENPELFAGRSV